MTGFATGEIALAICARCSRKRPYTALVNDPNSPGLRVCGDPSPGSYGSCGDEFDPYRLPPRQTEALVMRFPRPDVSIAATTQYLVADGKNQSLLETEDGAWIVISKGT